MSDDLFSVDPSVTEEELDLAHSDILPADFPDGPQDEVDEAVDGPRLLAASITPASPHQAILNARALRQNHTFVGVGYCLRTVHDLFDVPALWPDAATAGDHSAPFHALTDPMKAPRGSVGFAWNGGFGHTWLNLGGGLASTTDYHEPGYEGVALISKMLAWCGATRWGWGEVLNGYDVWPNPQQPKPQEHWTLERRLKFLRHEADRQRAAGHTHKADELVRWADQLKKLVKSHG